MKFENIEKKDLIHLIKDDLTNIYLVYGLETLRLNAGNYCLHLNETIFKFIGIKADKEVFLKSI